MKQTARGAVQRQPIPTCRDGGFAAPGPQFVEDRISEKQGIRGGRLRPIVLRITPALFLFNLLTLLTGCAGPPQRPPRLPPPRPAREVIRRLNQRTAELVHLRLVGTIKLAYVDRLGNRRNYQAHGVLLVDQRAALAGRGWPDMLLVGTYLGQDVFEMGMNRRIYWLINHNQKEAYVGAANPVHRPPPNVMPLRPRQVLAMLAITRLPHSTRRYTMMTSFPASSEYHLFIVRTPRAGRSWIERELIVDRYTDHVVRVALFNRNGQAVAAAVLSRYRPVAARGKKPGRFAPAVPLHIVIGYPAARSKLVLTIARASLTLRAKPRFIFASPSFAGLRVIDMDNPANWPNR